MGLSGAYNLSKADIWKLSSMAILKADEALKVFWKTDIKKKSAEHFN